MSYILVAGELRLAECLQRRCHRLRRDVARRLLLPLPSQKRIFSMTTETFSEPTENSAIDELVGRARSLYSLPVVAAEVIQLTSNPKVDTRALKECIETDPALTVKILRVVNSSLFGLSREVCDLNQALALLGTKPLKLLVLGFSLPENLFSEVAREQLDWYWSTTLARAVAAREISEQLFDRPGDDAFLAGLLQDLGVLVLLGELKEPYANFLSSVINQQADLQSLELDSLGFDHLELTGALLEHWNMPELLVRSISEPRNVAHLVKSEAGHAELARILHLSRAGRRAGRSKPPGCLARSDGSGPRVLRTRQRAIECAGRHAATQSETTGRGAVARTGRRGRLQRDCRGGASAHERNQRTGC